MTDKIKSVFRQREVEGLYELGIEVNSKDASYNEEL